MALDEIAETLNASLNTQTRLNRININIFKQQNYKNNDLETSSPTTRDTYMYD